MDSLSVAALAESSSVSDSSSASNIGSLASSNGERKLDESSLETSPHSAALLLSETTSELRTSDAGMDAWTSYLRDGRVRDSRPHPEGARDTPTFGPTFVAPSPSVLPASSSSRTSIPRPGWWLKPISSDSDSVLLAISFARLLWGLPIADRARFYWPTPTAKANHWAPSMRKWPAYRRLQDAIPAPSPELFEWQMGLPVGWISSGLPVREQFQQWLRSHGAL